MAKSYLHTPAFHVLRRTELEDIELSPHEVISLVEEACRRFAEGASGNPTKIHVGVPDESRDSGAYSMLGYDGGLDQLAFKTEYRQGSKSPEKCFTTISLYDDSTGMPFAFLDCRRITGLRTPATTAIIAKYAAKPDAKSALLVGTGETSQHTLAYLLETVPSLDTFRLFGTHQGGIDATLAAFARYHPDRTVELVRDVTEATHLSDIVVAASGRADHPKIKSSWLQPGGLLISVASKGVDPSVIRESDYAISTHIGQLGVSGRRLLDEDGSARIDAELPDIVAGRKPGRNSSSDRVYAFSTGMVITDIPVAHAVATRAIAAGRGTRIELWS